MESTLAIVQPVQVFLVSIVYCALMSTRFPWRGGLMTALASVALGSVVLAASVSIPSAAASFALAFLITVMLGVFNLTTRGTTLVIAVALSTLPIGAWLYPAAGLVCAGLLSAVMVWRRRGADYLKMTAGETLAAIGIVGGAIQSPDLDRLPVDGSGAIVDEEESLETRRAPRRINMPAVLLCALICGAALGIAFA